MTIKPKYSKYSQRLLQGLLSAIFPTLFWSIIMFLYDMWNQLGFGVLSFTIVYSLILTIYKINKSKIYLTELRVEGDFFVFETDIYDIPNETVKSPISKTRIKIYDTLFPFSRFHRSYKLIIETKKGLKYERIIQQYEIGNWNLDKFKEVIKAYGEVKGIPISTVSFK